MLLVSADCCAFAAFILPSRPTGVHVPSQTQILPPPCDVGLEVVGEEQNSSEFSQFSKICKENTKTSCDVSLTYKTFFLAILRGFLCSPCAAWVLCADFDITSRVTIFVALWQVKNTSVQLCCFFHSFNDVPVQKLRDIFLFLYQDFCCLGGNTCRSGEY